MTASSTLWGSVMFGVVVSSASVLGSRNGPRRRPHFLLKMDQWIVRMSFQFLHKMFFTFVIFRTLIVITGESCFPNFPLITEVTGHWSLRSLDLTIVLASFSGASCFSNFSFPLFGSFSILICVTNLCDLLNRSLHLTSCVRSFHLPIHGVANDLDFFLIHGCWSLDASRVSP